MMFTQQSSQSITFGSDNKSESWSRPTRYSIWGINRRVIWWSRIRLSLRGESIDFNFNT